MISSKSLSELLHKLYSAPAMPDLWAEFLEDFVKLLEIRSAGIVYQDEKRLNYGFSAITNMEQEERKAYAEYFGKYDPWVPPIHSIVPGRVQKGVDLCPPHKRDVEYFHDFACKYDRNLYCAVPTMKSGDNIEAVTFYTSFHDETPDQRTFDLIKFMVPHLQSALMLRRRFVDLREQNLSLEAALNLLSLGIVFVDHAGNVVLMNRSAEKIVDCNDGLSIKNRKLRASIPVEAARLEKLICAVVPTGKAEGYPAGGSIAVSRMKKHPLTITITPLLGERADFPPHSTAAIVFICDPEQELKFPADSLKQLYGLTPAEARLAVLLAKGHSLIEASAICGVSHNTVRSQLKNIFAKTGVSHQSGLIRMLFSAFANLSSI